MKPFEVPGAYLKWRSRSVAIKWPRPKSGENETSTRDSGWDWLLIVMGGPQSPDEDREAFPYYDLRQRSSWFKRPWRQIVILLGSVLVPSSCLLPMVRRMSTVRNVRLGFIPVTLTPEGPQIRMWVSLWRNSLKLATGMVICQDWTEDAVVLATSQGCPRQMIRFSPNIMPSKPTFEFDPEAVDLLIAADGEDVLEVTKSKPDLCLKTRSHSCLRLSRNECQTLCVLDSLTK